MLLIRKKSNLKHTSRQAKGTMDNLARLGAEQAEDLVVTAHVPHAKGSLLLPTV